MIAADDKPLQNAAQHQEGFRQSARRGKADEKRTGDAEEEAPVQHPHPAQAVGQATHDDDENAREQRRDGNGDIHDARLDPKSSAMTGAMLSVVWANSQKARRLG